MSRWPTGGRGQAIAWALVGLLALLGWFGGVAPLIDAYQQQAETIQSRAALLARLEQRAAALPRLRAAVARLPHQDPPPPLAGGSDAEAAAGLQEQLQNFAAGAKISIGSSEIVPAVEDGAYRKIGVKVTLSANYTGLLAFLGAIAEADTPLVVSGLDLTGPPRGAPEADPSLDAVITITGWAKPAP